MARRDHVVSSRGPAVPYRTTRALARRAFSCPKGAAWLQVLLTLAFVLLGCTSEPEQVSGRVDLLDVSHAALATGTLRFVNGTYGPACKGRSGGFSVALGATATAMDYPELSVIRGDAACTLTLTSVVGAETFTAQPPMALTGAFAPAGTTFVGSTGGSSVAFFANSRITPSTFTSDFVIDLLVSDDPKATSAGNAAGSYTGPSSSKSSVSLSRASEVADGFSPILATVTIKNYSGKALPGLSVNLVHSGVASVSPANVTTDTNGVATFQLTSNVITQGELTAKVTGVLVSARPTVVFTRLPMVGGTVAGLSGTGLTLTLTSSSGVATLTPGNGAFAFPPVLKGAWSMAITAQPTLPKQICSLANGAGVVDYTDVSNVAVTCLSAVPAVGASGTLVGTLTGGQSYSDGTGTAAAFNYPTAIAFDSAGTAYVADQWNNTIRKVTASGTVTTLAGTTTPGYRDGSGEVALFDNPVGIAVDGAGIVYVADQGNQRIRKIDPAGNVTTYAGNGTAGFADGAAATARFNIPTQLALDGSGNLYVADRTNHRIRRISPSGTVTTLAGNGVAGYADGSGTAAQLNSPTGVASDAAGNLVVVDNGNRRVRRVTSAGVVTTLAGSGLSGSADGTGTVATFYSPFNVALDGGGNALVVDGARPGVC